MTRFSSRVFTISLFAAATPCLFACSEPQSLTVSYDGNGLVTGIVPTDSNGYQPGQTVTVLGNPGNLAKAGYSFAGWNTQTDGNGATFTQGQTFTIASSNVILYAKWTQNPTFKVTYDGNGSTGGVVPVDTTNYESGQLVTVLGNTGSLTRTGFSFAGWNTQADGQGTTYSQGQTLAMGSAALTLYAKWSQNPTFTLTYDGNGNSGGAAPVDTTQYETGQVALVAGNTGNLVKTGFNFAAWNTKADGSGTSYTPGQSLSMGSDNLILYAQWVSGDYWKTLLTLPTNLTVEENSVAFQNNGTMVVVGMPIGGGTQFLSIDENSLTPVTVAATNATSFKSKRLIRVGNNLYFAGVDIDHKDVSVLQLVASGGSLIQQDTNFPDIACTTVDLASYGVTLYAVCLTTDDDIVVHQYDTTAASPQWVALPSLELESAEPLRLYVAIDTDGTIYISYLDGTLKTENIGIQKLSPGQSAWTAIATSPASAGWFFWGFGVLNGRIFLAVDNSDNNTVSAYLYSPANEKWSDYYIPVFANHTYVADLARDSHGYLYFHLCDSTLTNTCSVFFSDFSDAATWYTLGVAGFPSNFDHGSVNSALVMGPSDVPYYFYKMTTSPQVQLTVLKYVKEVALQGQQVAAPVFSVPAGSYLSPQQVKLTSTTQHATIYYTTDGSDPLTSFTRRLYVDSFGVLLDHDGTVRAVAIKQGYQASSAVSASYSIAKVSTPQFDHSPGGYRGPLTLHLSAYPADSVIYYTTDGSDPTTSGTRQQYSGSITLTASASVRAVGTKTGYTTSEIADAGYHVFTPALSGVQGAIQDIQVADGKLYVLTFDEDVNQGTSWLYRLENASGQWTQLAEEAPFWGKSLAFDGAVVYFGGIDPADKGVVYKYESGTASQVGDVIECLLATLASYNHQLYAGCRSTRPQGTYKFDGTKSWLKVSDEYLGSPYVYQGALYSFSGSSLYKTDSGGELVAIPYTGLAMLPERIREDDAGLKVLSSVNGMFATTASGVIYNDFFLPLLDGLLNYYLDFCYLAENYYLVAPWAATIASNKRVKRTIYLQEADAVLTHVIAFDGTVYYVVNGSIRTLTWLGS